MPTYEQMIQEFATELRNQDASVAPLQPMQQASTRQPAQQAAPQEQSYDQMIQSFVQGEAKEQSIQSPVDTQGRPDPVEDKIGFWENIERGGWDGFFDKASLGVKPMIEAASLYGATQRFQRDDYLDDEIGGEEREADRQKITDYLEEQAELAGRGLTVGAKVGNILGDMLPFMAEFMLTGGVSALGKKAVSKGVLNLVTKATGKAAVGAVGKATAILAGWTTAAGIRTALTPHRSITNFINERMPDIQVSPEGQLIFEESTDSPFKSMYKAIGNQFIEMASEESGAFLSLIAGKTISKILPKAAIKALNGLKESWMAAGPGRTAKEFANRMATKAGFNGILEEFGEERLGGVMRAVAQIEDGDGTTFENIGKALFPGAEQALVELIAFSVPGVARAGVAMAFEAKPDKTSYTRKEMKVAHPEIKRSSAADRTEWYAKDKAENQAKIEASTDQAQLELDEIRASKGEQLDEFGNPLLGRPEQQEPAVQQEEQFDEFGNPLLGTFEGELPQAPVSPVAEPDAISAPITRPADIATEEATEQPAVAVQERVGPTEDQIGAKRSQARALLDEVDEETKPAEKKATPQRRMIIRRGAHDPVHIEFSDDNSKDVFSGLAKERRRGHLRQGSFKNPGLLEDMKKRLGVTVGTLLEWRDSVKSQAKALSPQAGEAGHELKVQGIEEFIKSQKPVSPVITTPTEAPVQKVAPTPTKVPQTKLKGKLFRKQAVQPKKPSPELKPVPLRVGKLTDEEIDELIEQESTRTFTKGKIETKNKNQTKANLRKLRKERGEREKERITGMPRKERAKKLTEIENEVKAHPMYDIESEALSRRKRLIDVGRYFVPKKLRSEVYDIIGDPAKNRGARPNALQKMFTFDNTEGAQDWEKAVQDSAFRSGITGIDASHAEMDISEFVQRVKEAHELNPVQVTIEKLKESLDVEHNALALRWEMMNDGNFSQQEIEEEVKELFDVYKEYENEQESARVSEELLEAGESVEEPDPFDFVDDLTEEEKRTQEVAEKDEFDDSEDVSPLVDKADILDSMQEKKTFTKNMFDDDKASGAESAMYFDHNGEKYKALLMPSRGTGGLSRPQRIEIYKNSDRFGTNQLAEFTFDEVFGKTGVLEIKSEEKDLFGKDIEEETADTDLFGNKVEKPAPKAADFEEQEEADAVKPELSAIVDKLIAEDETKNDVKNLKYPNVQSLFTKNKWNPNLFNNKDNIIPELTRAFNDSKLGKKFDTLPDKKGKADKRILISEKRHQQNRKDILGGGLFAGIDPRKFVILTEIGLYHFETLARASVKGTVKFSAWSKSVVADLGVKVKPHLEKMWAEVKQKIDEFEAKQAQKAQEKAQKAQKPKKPAPKAKKTVKPKKKATKKKTTKKKAQPPKKKKGTPEGESEITSTLAIQEGAKLKAKGVTVRNMRGETKNAIEAEKARQWVAKNPAEAERIALGGENNTNVFTELIMALVAKNKIAAAKTDAELAEALRIFNQITETLTAEGQGLSALQELLDEYDPITVLKKVKKMKVKQVGKDLGAKRGKEQEKVNEVISEAVSKLENITESKRMDINKAQEFIKSLRCK